MVLKDPNSVSNFDEVVIRHIDLEWNVSFENKRITGSAAYDIEFLEETDTIIFDGDDLTIQSVNAACNTAFSVEDNYPFGEKIIIKFGRLYAKNEKFRFDIKYETSSYAFALQFVEQENTEDKIAPILYSQCQPIRARSIVPCQDTPSVKQTYSASVTVPSNLTCLMGALSKGHTEPTEQNTKTYKFNQPMAIPSYLLAIVVGRFERRIISERCAIWSEPSIADAAQNEFIDTERMLSIAEKLLGEYVWTRYDMVILPSHFSFGGMENPMLTFLPRTLLIGDRSMVNVVAHEICHSWMGNLVTNANWQCFWLSEGFTKFMENKVMGEVRGEKFRQFLCYTDWHTVLKSTIEDEFSPTHEYTKLMPDLSRTDPDNAFSSIPYVKGSAFLLLLEQRLGGHEIFNKFLRSYIQKFAQQSVTVEDFLSYLREYFKEKESVLSTISIDKWLNDPGMPPETPEFDETCRQLVENWAKSPTEKLPDADLASIEQISMFKILENQPDVSSVEKVTKMDGLYNISKHKNADVLSVWIMFALRNRYRPIIPHALVRKYGIIETPQAYLFIGSCSSGANPETQPLLDSKVSATQCILLAPIA